MSRIKLALIMPWRENKGVCQFKRILDGWIFGLPTARNLWGKSCLRCCVARNNLTFREAANKIFKKISTENALEYLAFGKGFIMDRLTGSTSKLESWTKSLTRICVLRVFRGFFLVAYGKKSLEEIFNEIWPLARNQSSEFRRNLYGK